MNARPLIAIALAALMTGAAFAEPVLRPEVTVAAAIVTVGDMFENAGRFAEEPLFRAPRPGTIGTVPLEDVEAAASRIGLDAFESAGLTAIKVARAGIEIGQADLVGLIEADLAGRGILTAGMSTQTVLNTPFVPVMAASTAEPVSLIALRYLPGSIAFSARFTVAGVETPVEVGGTIDLMIEAPHLAEALPAGAVLHRESIVMRPVPLRYTESHGFATPDQLVGKALRRQSREGLMLKAGDVDEPELISRNDLVTIYYRSGPMTLTVKGQALNAAAAGDAVQVLNLMSKRVIATKAIAAGAVEIDAASINIAGL